MQMCSLQDFDILYYIGWLTLSLSSHLYNSKCMELLVSSLTVK